MSDLIRCCSWCVQEGRAVAPPEEQRTDGICRPHAAQLMLLTPLETAAARLRSNEYLGRDARVAIARDIQTVVSRLDRLTIHESPPPSPSPAPSLPGVGVEVAASGDVRQGESA